MKEKPQLNLFEAKAEKTEKAEAEPSLVEAEETGAEPGGGGRRTKIRFLY